MRINRLIFIMADYDKTLLQVPFYFSQKVLNNLRFLLLFGGLN